MLLAVLLGAQVGCYRMTRAASADLVRHQGTIPVCDAIVVPGCPARPDGTASTCIERRVRAAVAAWRAHVAPRILFSGGAVHNRVNEAQAMADYARLLGVPDRALIVEPRARHTAQNLLYASYLLLPRGFRRVLVVTDALQLPFAMALAVQVGFDAYARLSHADLSPRELRQQLVFDGYEPVPRAWWR